MWCCLVLALCTSRICRQPNAALVRSFTLFDRRFFSGLVQSQHIHESVMFECSQIWTVVCSSPQVHTTLLDVGSLGSISNRETSTNLTKYISSACPQISSDKIPLTWKRSSSKKSAQSFEHHYLMYKDTLANLWCANVVDFIEYCLFQKLSVFTTWRILGPSRNRLS